MHIAAAQEIVHRLIPALMSALYLKRLGEKTWHWQDSADPGCPPSR
jgi:hypothetical protein